MMVILALIILDLFLDTVDIPGLAYLLLIIVAAFTYGEVR